MKNTMYLAAFFLSLNLLSCGSGDYNTSADTGSASFGLKFEEAPVPSAVKLAQSAARATDICSSYGIEYISGTVYNSSNSAIATGGPWACADHQGTINNIPAGSNLRIAIQGTVSGSVVWQGETTGITIYPDQDTNVGSITMIYTGSDTTSPTVSAATPTGTNVPVTSPITVTFSEAMASSTIDSTTFTLKNGSVAVSGSVSYNSTTRTATFTPTSSLSNSVIYTSTVTTDVTDMAANKMQSLYTWDFTTEAPPGSAPTTPTGVSPTAADKQVTINWTAVSGATSYNMYWSNTTGVTKTNGTQITGATSPYIHTALTNGTTYYYVVTAVNSYGESGESSQVNAMPSSGTDVTAPSNTTAADFTNSGESSTSSTSVTLAISATDTVGVTAYYTSETSSTPSASASGWTAITSTTSYSASVSFTLSSGDGTKTVYVWFKDAAGYVSAVNSDSITLSTGSIPPAPTGVTAIAGNGQATTTWPSVSGATSYNIYWSTTFGVTKTTGIKSTGATSPYTHTGLTNWTTYYYVVTAVNSYGESSESNQIDVIPQATATTLASGLFGPYDIAVDSMNVYWTEMDGGTVKKVSINGGTVTTLASGLNAPYAIALDSTSIYWTEFFAGTVKRVSINGGTVLTLASGLSNPRDIAVDSTSVYWTEDIGTVKKVSINGGTVTTLASGLSYAQHITIDSTCVYWTETIGGGSVKKVSINGGAVTTLASASVSNAPAFIAIDSSSVYYGETGTIKKVSIDGGTVTTLVSGLNAVADIDVDATDVYWADVNATGNVVGAIKKVSINGGSVTTLASGLDGTAGMAGIALDFASVYLTEYINGTGTVRKVAK